MAYKDSQTQKWIHYNEFEANINSYTAKINPVDIYSRYIRIKPLKFVKTKINVLILSAEGEHRRLFVFNKYER